jgi:cation diffusion facilitator CzcD-associated flavoprotein CzcO
MRIAIIGAGFAGLAAAYRLRQAGFTDFSLFERSSKPGGTWRDNTYPGCQCDVPSHLYSLSFFLKPDWSQLYAPQAEIQEYLESFIAHSQLGENIEFNSFVRAAEFLEDSRQWRLTIERLGDDGPQVQLFDSVICATGPLNRPVIPALPGLDTFRGQYFHSSAWPQSLDLKGKKVALVGTGASAIQIGPGIAETVEKLFILQRTPAWIMPRQSHPYGAFWQNLFVAFPMLMRLHRYFLYWQQEVRAFGFLGLGPLSEMAQFLARYMALWHLNRAGLSKELRASQIPDYKLGCKRILLSDDWYKTLRRANVELIPQAVVGCSEQGVLLADGVLKEVDSIVFATGFAATDYFAPLTVKGLAGIDQKTAFAQSAANYLGICKKDFPDFYMMVGPGTGLGHNSIIFMMECQLHFILQALQYKVKVSGMEKKALRVSEMAQSKYYDAIRRRMKNTVFESGCKSWYQSKDGFVDILYSGFTFEYWLATRRFKAQDFIFD